MAHAAGKTARRGRKVVPDAGKQRQQRAAHKAQQRGRGAQRQPERAAYAAPQPDAGVFRLRAHAVEQLAHCIVGGGLPPLGGSAASFWPRCMRTTNCCVTRTAARGFSAGRSCVAAGDCVVTGAASGCGAAFRGSFGSIRYLLVPAVYRAKYSPLLPLKSWSGSMLWLPMRAS